MSLLPKATNIQENYAGTIRSLRMIFKRRYATDVKPEDNVSMRIDGQRLWIIKDNNIWLEFSISFSEKLSLIKQLIKEWLEA